MIELISAQTNSPGDVESLPLFRAIIFSVIVCPAIEKTLTF